LQHQIGERNANSILTIKDVVHIRDEFHKNNGKVSISKIAKGYGVTYSCISSVIKKLTWKG
jgi:GTP-sensing pleiotropic transcriptional regulator CodY